MNEQKPKIVIVVGPTASGKTSLSIELARRFNGEIISADSRQIYRKLDIGTAKVTKEEMAGIPHHLIDIVDINQVYSAADFKRDGETAISTIQNRGHLPIIAGGTFFYVDVLLGKAMLPNVEPNQELRTILEDKATDELLTELEAKDPRRFKSIDKDNRRRIIRALEIIQNLEQVPTQEPTEEPYDSFIIGINTEKETLRTRYRDRATIWLANGFQNEVKRLLKDGASRDRLGEIGFEYRLMLELIDGEINKEAFVQKFIEKNWQYARRQTVWLKRDKSIHWFESDDSVIFEEVEEFLKG